jgi:hypothetical protein
LTECIADKIWKKVQGKNEIKAALKTLDRLTEDEVRATGALTFQAVMKDARELVLFL